MKKVLILVLSSEHPPYDALMECSKKTWNSIDVEGCETIFYTGASLEPNTDTFISFPIGNSIFDMMKKNIAIFEYILANKEFDYVCRVNASCYVNKKVLLGYVQTLPDENVFCGAEVTDESKANPVWFWGGCSFIFSKDVIQKIVDNKEYCNHEVMEDRSVSMIINKLKITVIPAKSATIDKSENKWRLMLYGGGESFLFTEFEDIKKAKDQFLYRVKQDQERHMDEFIMYELFRVLN